jgi:hypothetical protein
MGRSAPNGEYCNFADPPNGYNQLSNKTLCTTFLKSGNVFSFDRASLHARFAALPIFDSQSNLHTLMTVGH